MTDDDASAPRARSTRGTGASWLAMTTMENAATKPSASGTRRGTNTHCEGTRTYRGQSCDVFSNNTCVCNSLVGESAGTAESLREQNGKGDFGIVRIPSASASRSAATICVMSVASHLAVSPAKYDARIRSLIPLYDELIAEVARALGHAARPVRIIVDLGIGTGALARACLESRAGRACLGHRCRPGHDGDRAHPPRSSVTPRDDDDGQFSGRGAALLRCHRRKLLAASHPDAPREAGVLSSLLPTPFVPAAS